MNGIDFLELAKDADADVPVGQLFEHAELLEKHPVLTESFEKDQLVVALWDAPVFNATVTLVAGNEYVLGRVEDCDDVSARGRYSSDHASTSCNIRYRKDFADGFDPRRIFMPANFKFEDLKVGMTLRPTHRFGSYHTRSRIILPERTFKITMIQKPGSLAELIGPGIKLSGQFEGADRVRDEQWFGRPRSSKRPDTLAIPIQCAFTIEEAAPLPPEQQTLLDGLKALAETPEGKAVLAELLGS